MLTVASPPVDPAQVTWVSKLVEVQIRQVRSSPAAQTQPRRSIVVVFPKSIDSAEVERKLSWVAQDLAAQHLCSDVRPFSGAGFTGVDIATNLGTADLQSARKSLRLRTCKRMSSTPTHGQLNDWRPVNYFC